MLKLIPMQDTEFEPFMEISMRDQAEGQVKAGRWKANEADANMQKLRAQFLPGGMNTPYHYFFTLEAEDLDQKVGGLWYALMEQGGKQMCYVMDIQIYPEYRRHGYGSQAFLQMETQVLGMGISTIALHVFQHNRTARAMYEKLGYVGQDEDMVKELL